MIRRSSFKSFGVGVSIQVFKVIASPQFRKLFIGSVSYRKRKMDEGIILERLQRENRELREEVNRLRKELEEKESRINELEGRTTG